MFGNGRKTIGLFIFSSYEPYQQEICHGVAEQAYAKGYNVAVFNSFGRYGDNVEYFDGEARIFDLPDYSKFAGIVLATDTFNIEGAKEKIMEHIRSEARCPVVSLRQAMNGINNILLDERETMDEIIRHVIEVHKVKDIAFMSGPKDRYDANFRLACFKRIMNEYGYEIGENRIYYGDFWKDQGDNACDYFSSGGKWPEAIICANDNMALSVCDVLCERGIRVPEDIIVTGYDGEEEGKYYQPALTTVEVDFKDMAHQAVNLIDKHQEDLQSEMIYAKTKCYPKESCGCKKMDVNFAKRSMHYSSNLRLNNMEMQFSFMSIDFGKIRKICDMPAVIRKYIYNFEDFTDYYLCLCDELGQRQEKHTSYYTDKMHLRVGFHNRTVMSAPGEDLDMIFSRKELLPHELIDEAPQCFYFVPVHYQNTCFGYEAYRFSRPDNGGSIYARWTIAVANAIEAILVQQKLHNLIDELENMYIRDVMTGLYNRRGFENYARTLFLEAKVKEISVCVIGIDADGLKPVNDIFGHHEGDNVLRAVGYAINEAGSQGQIGARIGGDEFEVILMNVDEDDAKHWVYTFERSLENYNKKSGKPYEVHASAGYRVGIPGPSDTLESFMKESDDIMYQNKIENKRRRNEPLR